MTVFLCILCWDLGFVIARFMEMQLPGGFQQLGTCYTPNAADHTDLSYWHPSFEVHVSSIYTSLAEMETKSLYDFFSGTERTPVPVLPCHLFALVIKKLTLPIVAL